jgi:hypothetical protein
MAMQYDVLSYHNSVSGVAVPYRTRLKGIVISPSTSTTLHIGVMNNIYSTGTYSQTGTTMTVTLAAHGLSTGDHAWLNCTSGNGDSNLYIVTKVNANSFTVTSPTSESASGNVNVYTQLLCHPSLSVEVSDLVGARELAILLKEDADFYNECSTMAKQRYHEIFTKELWLERIKDEL